MPFRPEKDLIQPDKPPDKSARLNHHWVYHAQCNCVTCPWLPNCRGRKTSYWIETPNG